MYSSPPPLVSIITPSFNQGRFIQATIKSVLSQDYPHIEYIIMDGGSQDETASIVASYADQLTWISEPDRGQTHAINKGFRLARGAIVSWLNSDDMILPGAVSRAVHAFERQPELGAVYGEGYLIDIRGTIRGRFPHTEPFNLWKLVYLSDYLLQQAVYFRKTALDAVGDLDEELQWSMDWDILIRLGKRFPMHYIPAYMGAIREYSDTKTGSGGLPRWREITRLLRRHGQLRYPPGVLLYGLGTYENIWQQWLADWTPPLPARWSARTQQLLSAVIQGWAGRLVHAQGWYADGWATTQVRSLLPASQAEAIVIKGKLPRMGSLLPQQTLQISVEGRRIATHAVQPGIFALTVPIPVAFRGQPIHILLTARRSFVPSVCSNSPDRRRLCYLLHSIAWSTDEASPESVFEEKP